MKMMKHRHPISSNFRTILLFIIILFAASQAAAAAAKDTLLSGQCISTSETLISKSSMFELGFFASYGAYNLGIRYKNLVERNPVFLLGAVSYLF